MKTIKDFLKITGIAIAISSAIAGLYVGGVKLAYTILDGEKIVEQNAVIKILDITNDKRLSESEIKRFYDETGISPYNTNAFRNLPAGDYKKFLENYESVYKKK